MTPTPRCPCSATRGRPKPRVGVYSRWRRWPMSGACDQNPWARWCGSNWRPHEWGPTTRTGGSVARFSKARPTPRRSHHGTFCSMLRVCEQAHTPPAAAAAGRGLRSVAELADEWGVEAGTAGKAVWFEVDLPAEERLQWGRTHAEPGTQS